MQWEGGYGLFAAKKMAGPLSMWLPGPVLWQLGVRLGFQKGLRVVQLPVSVAETEDTGKPLESFPASPSLCGSLVLCTSVLNEL